MFFLSHVHYLIINIDPGFCHSFCKKSISDVREFLVKYFEDRTEAFYTKVKDPLITFYEALCVRSDLDMIFDDILQESLDNIGQFGISLNFAYFSWLK